MGLDLGKELQQCSEVELPEHQNLKFSMISFFDDSRAAKNVFYTPSLQEVITEW